MFSDYVFKILNILNKKKIFFLNNYVIIPLKDDQHECHVIDQELIIKNIKL